MHDTIIRKMVRGLNTRETLRFYSLSSWRFLPPSHLSPPYSVRHDGFRSSHENSNEAEPEFLEIRHSKIIDESNFLELQLHEDI